MGVSRSVFRRRLLAGASVVSLALHAAPAMAMCRSAGTNTTITTSTACVTWTGGNLSVTNTGIVSGSGVSISGSNPGGTLTNSGSISSSAYGVLNLGTIGTVANSGSISGASSGIRNYGGSIGVLTNSGAISGSGSGIVNYTGSIGTLANSGSISGINNSGGSIGTLANSGTISGISNSGGSIGTLSNSSSISGAGIGISNSSSGSISALTNASGGSISGGVLSGIYNLGSIANLTNGGGISGTGAHAVGIFNGGSIGALTNSGSISGNGSGAIFNQGGIGVLTNSGSISGTASGIYNSSSIGTLANSGAVNGSSVGIANFGGSIANLTNSGTISGGSGVFNSGVFNYSGGIGTLANSGAISDTSTQGAGILNYDSSIGAVANSGTIIGGEVGIYNFGGNHDGSIGAVANSGTISGGLAGIYNYGGSIGALANSGTISGPVAIDNTSTGTLGPITNSGLIAGNIVNAAARDLTINGASGTGFGTLTGASGSIGSTNQGTITNTSSNVVFGSGNLLLNDAINVGSNSVITSGATIAVANPVSVTGAWQQSGGGLVAQASSAASYGYLSVSGNATVANAAVVIQGAGLINGNSFTIVRSGATGSYTGDTASIVGSGGLIAAIQPVGGDLVVTLTAAPAFYATAGDAAGGVSKQLGVVLDQINGGTSPTDAAFQSQVLVPLALLSTGQRGQAMKQLAPMQNTFQVVDAGAITVLGAVEQHQQTSMAYNPATGEAAGSDTLDSTLWAQMLGGGSERDSNAEADGYRSSDFGLTAGADHLFTPDLLGGVALSWLRAWTRGTASSSGQSSTMDSYQLTFYGTYRMGRAFLDGQLGAGWNHFDQNRSISFLNQTASAGYDGQQYLASALAGYDIGVGGPGNMTLTPLAGLRWLHAHTDSYTENGAGAADLSVNGQTTDAVTHELGFRTAWDFQTGIGRLQPELTVEWLHDYTNGPIATSGVIGGQGFVVTTPRVSANGARIGVAATLAASDSLSFRAEYDGELRAGYQSHTGLIKAMWQF